MRLVKLVVMVVLVIAASEVGFAQSQREDYASAERGIFNEPVSIYPNPAVGDYVQVKTETVPASNIKLAVHNILGNEMSVEVEVVDEHELRVKVKDLAAGYYFIAVKDRESSFQRAFKFLRR